jgi:ATP-binding cassette subfamily B protein
MGFFGNLEADKYDRSYSDVYLTKRIWNYIAKYRGAVSQIVVGFTVLSIVSSLRPILISEGMDAFQGEQNFLMLVIGGLLLSALIEYAANWMRRRQLSNVIGNLVAQMRKDTFSAAMGRDMAFYDRNKTGKIVSRITSDTQEFGDVMLFTSDVLAQLISIGLLLVILLQRSVFLTFIVLVTMPLYFGATIVLRNLARRVTRHGSRAMAVVNDNIQESVTGITVAKNFRREAMIYQEFTDVNLLSYNTNMRRGGVLATVFPVMNLLDKSKGCLSSKK